MGRKFWELTKKIISINTLVLILILFVGLALRILWIDKSPPALNWDEAALGYNAYSLATTGKDEFGNTFPILLRSFDDYKPALYSYLTIPFIKIFGLNHLGIRAVSVISGVTIILFIYLIADQIFKKQKIGLLSALLVATEPWSVHFSRVAFEANLGLALFLAGIYFLLKSQFINRIAILGTMFLALSAYAYHSQKTIFIPFFLGISFVFWWRIKNNKKIWFVCILTAIFLLLPISIQHIQHPETLDRFESTSIIKVWRSKTNDNQQSYLYNNPYTLLLQETAARYLSYFSPVNLFVRGTPEPSQHISNFGMFYNFEFVFWTIGLFLLLKKIRRLKFLVLSLLIFPLPAVITWNWFYPARVLPLFSIFSILTAWGMESFYQITKSYLGNKKNFLLWLTFAGFFLISTANLLTSLLFYLPYKESGNWQYGMKEIITSVSQVESKYNQVIFETRTAQPHIFVLLYVKYPPGQYHKEIAGQSKSPRKNFDFGKYRFRDVYWDKDKNLSGVLLVGPESSLPLEKVQTASNIEFIKDVKDSSGNFLARLVGLK